MDSIDPLIKKCCLRYHSCKYWHAQMLYAVGFSVVVAYDIYLELLEINTEEDWKLVHPVDFWKIIDFLSIQTFNYCPINGRYIGNYWMHLCTKHNNNDRSVLTPSIREEVVDLMHQKQSTKSLN